MRITVTCPACDGEQSAFLEFHCGASYGGRNEDLVDFEWEPATAETDCHCERDGEAEQRAIDAAGEPNRD